MTNGGKVEKTQYESLNISKEQFSTFPFHNGYEWSPHSDKLITPTTNALEIGDVVAFARLNSEKIVMHRIVDIQSSNSTTRLAMMGDNADYVEIIGIEAVMGLARESRLWDFQGIIEEKYMLGALNLLPLYIRQ